MENGEGKINFPFSLTIAGRNRRKELSLLKNHYELLGVDKSADAAQIKSAYGSLILKFTPESFPVEFAELQEAYETLSDKEKRAEYDIYAGLPDNAALIFRHARDAQNAGHFKAAADVLIKLSNEYPDYPEIKEELAAVYEEDDKAGKAMKVWEELCALYPENARYALALGDAYSQRGWNRKALVQFNLAVKLDPTNPEAWGGLIDGYSMSEEYDKAYEICVQAMDALQKYGLENLDIYAAAIAAYLHADDAAAAEDTLKRIVAYTSANPAYPIDEYEEMLGMLMIMIGGTFNFELLVYIEELIELRPDINPNISYALDSLNTIAYCESLEERDYPILFPSLFESLIDNCDCRDCKDDRMAMECSILKDIEGYRPHLERLKTELPPVYEMYAAFFDQALAATKPDVEKMLAQRLRKLDRRNIEPSFIAADDTEPDYYYDALPQETYRREGPKVGRNDPCPCGSGKKYKKCCFDKLS